MMMPLMLTMTQRPDLHRSRSRILIVEADRHTRACLEDSLESDYDLTCVWNSEEALRLMTPTRFDLVLLDMQMPHIDSLDILHRLRAVFLAAELPVILLSGLMQDEDVVRGLQQGANDYIIKPFDMHVMRARIRCQLALKNRLDEQQQTISSLKTRYEIKDRFLQIASHDLKNPLNNLMLAHYQLQSMLGDNPEADEALATIEDSVHSMSDLVEDFLDSAALENGRPDLQLQTLEMLQIIPEVIEHHEASASRKGIVLQCGNIEGVTLADYRRLHQILSNLVSNAIKFSPPIRIVTLSSEQKADRVHITVADQGPGIPPGERADLFKPFSKLSPRPTGGESSTGLGLWIVKELVTLQNGVVSADFPVDGGSRFQVELPASITP